MDMRPQRARVKRRQRGGLLVDVLIGMFFMIMATMSLMSLFPVIKRGEQISTEDTKAVQMCNRLVEHIQMLGAKDITVANLTALNLVDQGQASLPLSFTHIPLDEASLYSPHQVLRDANGNLNYQTIGGGAILVTVTLEYVSDSGQKRVIQTGTVVGAFR